MSWAPSGLVSGSAPRRAGSAAPTARRWRAPSRACDGVRPRSPSCQVTSAPSPSACDRADAGAGDDLGAGLAGRGEQRVGDRAHAAHRHPPLAGAVADQVVEEARGSAPATASLHVGEGADQRVGGDDAAHGVVGEAALDGLAERLLDELVPGVGVDPRRGPRGRWAAARAASARPPARTPRPRRRTCATRRTPSSEPVSSRNDARGRLALGALDEQAAVLGRRARPACTTRVARDRSSRSSPRSCDRSGSGIRPTEVGVAREPRAACPANGLRRHRRAAGRGRAARARSTDRPARAR